MYVYSKIWFYISNTGIGCKQNTAEIFTVISCRYLTNTAAYSTKVLYACIYTLSMWQYERNLMHSAYGSILLEY